MFFRLFVSTKFCFCKARKTVITSSLFVSYLSLSLVSTNFNLNSCSSSAPTPGGDMGSPFGTAASAATTAAGQNTATQIVAAEVKSQGEFRQEAEESQESQDWSGYISNFGNGQEKHGKTWKNVEKTQKRAKT